MTHLPGKESASDAPRGRASIAIWQLDEAEIECVGDGTACAAISTSMTLYASRGTERAGKGDACTRVEAWVSLSDLLTLCSWPLQSPAKERVREYQRRLQCS